MWQTPRHTRHTPDRTYRAHTSTHTHVPTHTPPPPPPPPPHTHHTHTRAHAHARARTRHARAPARCAHSDSRASRRLFPDSSPGPPPVAGTPLDVLNSIRRPSPPAAPRWDSAFQRATGVPTLGSNFQPHPIRAWARARARKPTRAIKTHPSGCNGHSRRPTAWRERRARPNGGTRFDGRVRAHVKTHAIARRAPRARARGGDVTTQGARQRHNARRASTSKRKARVNVKTHGDFPFFFFRCFFSFYCIIFLFFFRGGMRRGDADRMRGRAIKMRGDHQIARRTLLDRAGRCARARARAVGGRGVGGARGGAGARAPQRASRRSRARARLQSRRKEGGRDEARRGEAGRGSDGVY